MMTPIQNQKGFSLIELMIGLVIGLIATLVITNVFSKFEQQKRSTMGTADAQTNGAIALYQIRREFESAGFGLPVFIQNATPLRCYPSDANVTNPMNSAESVTVDHDGLPGTPNIGLSPVIIVDGAAGASDQIAVRYGNAELAGAAADVVNTTDLANPILKTGLGCKSKNPATPGALNYALIMSESVNDNASICEFVDVTSRTNNTLNFATTPSIVFNEKSLVACVGEWNEHRFAVANNQLTVTGTRKTATGGVDATAIDLVPEIVSIQAQYGISDNDYQNNVTAWVDATGGVWGPSMTVDNRNRIKAIRLAVVARNGIANGGIVSQACDGTAVGVSTVCIWNQDAAPANVNLAADANWQNYRYKVYETVVPLRNTLSNQPSLCEGRPC